MAFIGVPDDFLPISVVFAIVFGVALPEFGLFLVKLAFVVLFLVFLLDLLIKVASDVLLLSDSKFFVFVILLLLPDFLETHVLTDLQLLLLYHFALFLDDGVVLLVNELEGLLFTSEQLFLS